MARWRTLSLNTKSKGVIHPSIHTRSLSYTLYAATVAVPSGAIAGDRGTLKILDFIKATLSISMVKSVRI